MSDDTRPFVELPLSAAAVTEGELATTTLPSGMKLCVGRHQGALFAIKDECPHAEFPLSEGTLYPSGELECCWHGARFDCLTGAVRGGPTDLPLVRFEIVDRDGSLWVRRAI
jgi:3-phenylpropionate/trans-cinnamate dioxygenase ferredoxin subunit